jgi:hypothetical protein
MNMKRILAVVLFNAIVITYLYQTFKISPYFGFGLVLIIPAGNKLIGLIR